MSAILEHMHWGHPSLFCLRANQTAIQSGDLTLHERARENPEENPQNKVVNDDHPTKILIGMDS